MAVVLEKILTRTDVEHRLTFETRSLQFFHFGDGIHYVDFEAVDVREGSTREFRLYKRKDGHPKPVISKGWIDYVKYKGLQIGDKVIIQVNNDGRTPFSIQVQRNAIQVCGKPDWYDM